MVLSRINNKINYIESDKIEETDLNYSAAMYEMTILENAINIAVGKANTDYIDNNVVFYSLYLVFKDKIISRIGLYEIESNNVNKYLDDDGDLNIELLEMPLLFSFITEQYLAEKTVEMVQLEDTQSIKPPPPPIVEETYDETKTETWIERYLHSNKYKIKDNAGGGDCLFHVIVDALSEVDSTVTVDSLRKILANNVTETVYRNYKELYESYMISIKSDTNKLNELNKRNKELIELMKQTKDRAVQSELVKEAKLVKEEYSKIKEEKAVTNELLSDVKFMKNIKNISKLKEKVQTCEFWGEAWSISILERVMNIKLILFSEQSYLNEDIDNVLQCGEVDVILQNKGIFRPDHYIFADYNGWHYKLIMYDSKPQLSFVEIPNKIKELIVHKCMEKQGGAYDLIPEFNQYKKLIQQTKPEDSKDEDMADIEQSSQGLYTDDVVFQFYSKSNDKPLPGKGSGETIPKDMVKKFSELSKIPSWRRKLSNFWESEFVLDEHKWLTVEHYYQGSKFKNGNNKYYLEFSLDSGSILSKDPVRAKAAGGKTGKIGKTMIRPSDIKMDEDFFTSGRSIEEMNRAQLAKFTQSEELKDMLIKTQNAKLVHFQRGSEPIEFTNLMKIRNDLIK